jgi:hypothetical protein
MICSQTIISSVDRMIRFHSFIAGVIDTGKQFIAGVVDTGEQFLAVLFTLVINIHSGISP